MQQVTVANDHADAQRLVALLVAHDVPAMPRVAERTVFDPSGYLKPRQELAWSVVVPKADTERARAVLAAAAASEPQGMATSNEIERALDAEEDDEDDEGDDEADAPDLGMQASLWFLRVVVGAIALLIVAVILRLVFRW